MIDAFLEFTGETSPWLFLLLLILYFWGKLNHDALHSYNTHPKSFDRVIEWLRENNLGLLYLNILGWLMDKIGGLIGDRQNFNQIYVVDIYRKGFICKVFGFNPFTPESYEKCLYLAFLYPVCSFFITWILGGTGQIGTVGWINLPGKGVFADLSGWGKLVLFIASPLPILGGLWLVSQWKGWHQWLVLNIIFILIILGWPFLSPDISNIDWERSYLIWLVFFFLFALIYLGGFLMGWLIYDSAKRAHNEIYNIAFTLAFTSIVIGLESTFIVLTLDGYMFTNLILSSAFAFAVAIAGTAAAAIIAIFTLTAAQAGGTLIALFFAFIVGIMVVFVKSMQQRLNARSKLGLFWLIYSIGFFMLSYISPVMLTSFFYGATDGDYSDFMIMMLLLLQLPMVNAPLDWLSLGVTRGLLQAVRVGQHSGWMTLVWALVDLVLALLFLFLITAALLGVTTLGNIVSGRPGVDIGGILQSLRCEPNNVDYWWLYFMLFSTLVPTLIHFALAGGAATLWIPRPVRLWLADGLERDHHKTFLAWVYLTFMPVWGFILVPGALLYLLWWLVTMHDAWLGTHLLDWADMLVGRDAGICEATLK